jgi:hypothetical protein
LLSTGFKGGVDINTVAGRLGHGGGGTTTLKYYAGWVAEAEQRAAISLGARMPQRDWRETTPTERAKENPRNPYEVVACAVRQAILAGVYADGDPAPTVTGLASAHNVSDGTAHRAGPAAGPPRTDRADLPDRGRSRQHRSAARAAAGCGSPRRW